MELLRRLDRELYLELLTQLLSTLHNADSLGCAACKGGAHGGGRTQRGHTAAIAVAHGAHGVRAGERLIGRDRLRGG